VQSLESEQREFSNVRVPCDERFLAQLAECLSSWLEVVHILVYTCAKNCLARDVEGRRPRGLHQSFQGWRTLAPFLTTNDRASQNEQE
jgi:hypothetical protein